MAGPGFYSAVFSLSQVRIVNEVITSPLFRLIIILSGLSLSGFQVDN